jgi:putative ABC transport system permease protein
MVLRNVGRRKLRSALTIAGIVIGVIALTTMGALGEHFNALFDGGIAYYGSTIPVSDDSGNPLSLIPVATEKDLEGVDGVAAAVPSISLPAQVGSLSVVNFNAPLTIASWDSRMARYPRRKVHVAMGRMVGDSAQGEVTLGHDFARSERVGVGDAITLPLRPADPKLAWVKHDFRVVGLLESTGTGPDSLAYVSLADAQMLLAERLPAMVRPGVNASTVCTGFSVYPSPGASADHVADLINEQVAGVRATRPSQTIATFKSGGAVLTAITTAAALLAMLVGGLAVVNTMFMAVSERAREIGVRRAIGASQVDVLREFLIEAGVVGLTGGLLGLAISVGFTQAANAASPSGSGVFLITWRLAAFAVVFATGLGIAAGLLPAARAARLDPVVALRSP